ncbi:MAG: septation protein A [Gammaproteobacteria bacterium]|nr:septation protein A [Gammaproteobacteria bacterium]
MKLLASFFPIILFFIAYKTHGIYVATGVAMAAALLQTGWHWLRHRQLERMHLITLALLLVFGGMTLAFHDPTFIKWKPSVVNWLFGAAFLISPLFGGISLTERMMSQAISVPRNIWQRLNLAWGLFFLALGCLNLFVAYSFDEATWVNFKLFGLLGLTFAFIIAQSLYLARHVKDEPTTEKP